MSRLALLVVLVACSQERIEVSQSPASGDYNHGAFLKAVEKFVAANRTPKAFRELADTTRSLRDGMDRSTAEEAELKLMVLALLPVQAAAKQPMNEQIDTLAVTIWPTLLAEEIEADEILRKHDPKSADILPKPDEAPRAYLERICGKQLAADCKEVVPEYQGHVVSALAIRRATERVRIAVADCLLCSTDKGWADAVKAWETLDLEANTTIHDIERRADPANWPIAGAASEKDPGLPEAEITSTGEIVIGGERHGATTRIEALRDLRFQHGESSPIALHVRPDVSLAAMKGILADVRKSGAKRIGVIARGSYYPWERRIYWLSDTTGVRAGMRPTDSLQLLLHAVDHLAGPGAVARVD
jgi:hypothetical protein